MKTDFEEFMISKKPMMLSMIRVIAARSFDDSKPESGLIEADIFKLRLMI